MRDSYFAIRDTIAIISREQHPWPDQGIGLLMLVSSILLPTVHTKRILFIYLLESCKEIDPEVHLRFSRQSGEGNLGMSRG